MSKEKNSSNFLEPIFEIVEELIKLLIEFVTFLIRKSVEIVAEKNADHKRGYSKIDIKFVRKKYQTQNPESMGVSLKKKIELMYKDLNTSLHTFIAGASGFGKTVLMLLLQDRAMSIGSTVVFLDPKGDSHSILEFQKICKKNSRNSIIFSEKRIGRHTFNPLRNGTKTQVAERIMDCFQWSEQFYRDCCYQTLLEILNDLEKNNKVFSIHSIFELYENNYLNDKNQSLFIKLKSIVSSDFGELLRDDHTTDCYTLERARSENACIYVGLSAQAYNEIAYAVGKLFLGELLQLSYETLRDNKAHLVNPMSVFFDEFGSLVTNRFIELLNKCRAAKIEICMAVQSISDIDKVDPNLKNQIVENTSNIFVFKQRLDTSASFFSKAIGTIETKEYTQQIDENGKRGARSEKIVYEHIIHPDLIKNLKVGQCVLLRQNPMKVDLVNVRKLNLSDELASIESINHSIPEDQLAGTDEIFGG